MHCHRNSSKLLGSMLKWFLKLLTKSNRIHIRTHAISSTEELISLIDRFVDGPLHYEMEWDDFISWKNDNPQLEGIRDEIGQWEHLLFSKEKVDRLTYCNNLIELRNRLAALLNLPLRHKIID